MRSLIDNGRTGLLFRPNDTRDLAAQVRSASTRPAELSRMRREARTEFEVNYSAERNYRILMNIYGTVIERAGRRTPSGKRPTAANEPQLSPN
jgi:glycosyltransferase involved in cell wall biosynthesis